jgi:hypothetical protein
MFSRFQQANRVLSIFTIYILQHSWETVGSTLAYGFKGLWFQYCQKPRNAFLLNGSSDGVDALSK